MPATEFVKTVKSENRRSADEHNNLHGVIVSHRPHTTDHRVETSENDHENRTDPEAVEFHAAEIQVNLRQEG